MFSSRMSNVQIFGQIAAENAFFLNERRAVWRWQQRSLRSRALLLMHRAAQLSK